METLTNRNKLKIRLAAVTFILYFFNAISIKFHWYTSVWWLDMLMHALGGLWTCFILLWFIPLKKDTKHYLVKIFLGILVVGIGWEVFEFLVNNKYLAKEPFDIVDTLSDIFFDSLGGISGLLYFSQRIKLKDKFSNPNQ